MKISVDLKQNIRELKKEARFFQLAQELESGKLIGAMRGMIAAASLLLLAVLLYGSASRSMFQPTMVAGPPMTYADFRFHRKYACTAIPTWLKTNSSEL